MKQFKPYRAELIRDVNLIDSDNGEIIVSASKDKPVQGTVKDCYIKKIGRNKVKMCEFYPDVAPDKFWKFSSKWLIEI